MSNANRIHKRFAAVVIGTAMTVSLIPCLSTAAAETPQVDGGGDHHDRRSSCGGRTH